MPKLRKDGGSKRQNRKEMIALNVETEKRWWLWMPKLKSNDDDSEHRNWKYDYKRQTENAMMALNTETEKRWWLWTPKLRSDGGFER